MNANDYQTDALRTANTDSRTLETRLTNWALGITGEAGEIAEDIKKHVFHGKALDSDAVAKELGDLLWYIAVMSHELGYPLADVMAQNVAKLKARYPSGFVEGGGFRGEEANR